MSKWEIHYEIDCCFSLSNELLIDDVEFKQNENDINAIIVVDASNHSEAENIAEERLGDVLRVLGSELKQNISKRVVEIANGDEKENESFKCSYLNAQVRIKREFPYDKTTIIQKQIRLYQSDCSVKKVILLRNKPNPDTWENLYKIYEIIYKDVGDGKLKEWSSEKEINNFKHTANHPMGAGLLESRHGHLKQEPPQKPMLLVAAIELIERIFYKWIDDMMICDDMV